MISKTILLAYIIPGSVRPPRQYEWHIVPHIISKWKEWEGWWENKRQMVLWSVGPQLAGMFELLSDFHPPSSYFILSWGYGKADVCNIIWSYYNNQDDTALTWQMSLTAEELESENRKGSAWLTQTKSICQAPARPNSGTVDSHFRCVLGKLANCFLNPQ